MIGNIRRILLNRRLLTWALVAAVLLAAALFRCPALWRWLVLLGVGTGVGIGVVVLLKQPILGLLALVPAALVLRLEIGTGTEVALNPVTLLIPVLLVLWLLGMLVRQELRLVPSGTNRPLFLFLLGGLLSLGIGRANWDPAVPRSTNFLMVQLAQWGIFALSAGAFWLSGNLVQDLSLLRRLAFLFLALGGGLALLRVAPGSGRVLSRVSTHAVLSAAFWMLLAALAGGQLLFNRQLSRGWRIFFGITLIAVGLYAFYLQRETVANWAGVGAVAGVLAWLRWPRLRWAVIILLVVLAVSGLLFSAVYEFAGGGEEWAESGDSRLVLIGRVIEVTMHNPITGLGPAAYRHYAAMRPLTYGRAYWVAPQVNSHNNYVDLFSQAGLLGLILFFWFAVAVARLGLRMRAAYTEGFAAGYVNSMLAAGAGALILMLLIDGILPFVYNFGFRGFQASVLLWLFLGGLVSLDAIERNELSGTDDYAT